MLFYRNYFVICLRDQTIKDLRHFFQNLLLNTTGRSGGPEFDALVAKARSNPRQMTPQEWREILGPSTFEVARQKGTERPFTSPLYDNHKKGWEFS